MQFQSLQQDLLLPKDLTIWEWLFESTVYSPIHRYDRASLGGYEDAVSKQRLDWAQVKKLATYISTALLESGLREGDTVVLFSNNTIWYPVVMFAVLRLGGRVCGANPAYTVEELSYTLKTSGARALFINKDTIEVATSSAKSVGLDPRSIHLLHASDEGISNVHQLVERGKQAGSMCPPYFTIPTGKTNFEICGFLSFSSGTTGLPKAVRDVMIAHQNVIAQCAQIMHVTPKSHDRVLAVLPFFHITGLVHLLHSPLLINAEVIILPQYSMTAMLKAVQEYRIKELLVVPPILINLTHDPLIHKYDLTSLERFSCGAAPLSDEVLKSLANRFPSVGFKQGYGMTESCSCISTHPPSHYDFKFARTAGTICASTTVKVLKENGEEASFDEPGEILVKGPQVVMGYLNNKSATDETFDREGYLHTGDLGSVSRDGLLTIHDRIKEMIKVRGVGVAPAELEDLLLGHPSVEDVAVIGIPDHYNGQVPKAFIVVRKTVKSRELALLGQEIMQYVRKRKISHKAVREVEFVESIPKSPSGKILRRLLKGMQGEAVNIVREQKSRI